MRIISVITMSTLALLLPALSPTEAGACSGFFLGGEDGRLMAFSYDWPVSGGRLVVNPGGLAKTALVADGLTGASWTAKFGSMTFNQYGREFPSGGFNRAGLAMHALWLQGTSYPKAGGPAIEALQWIQHCLDSYRNVAEVAASARTMAITSQASLHFLACDASGGCAVIEFLDGAPVIRAADELPLPVLTNSTYAASIAALDRSLGYGGAVAPRDEEPSLDRFVQIASRLNTVRVADPGDPIERAFTMLAEIDPKSENKWRIVYDLRAKQVHFTVRGNPGRGLARLTTIDLRCSESGARTFDLSGPFAGDIAAALKPYSGADNLALVRSSVALTDFLQPFPEDRLVQMASYPDRLECVAPKTEPAEPGKRPYPVD